jgi:prophage antirepressor-like protein
MSNLQVFNFDSHNIRIVLIDGVEYWVAKDVAQALGYANPSDAVTDHLPASDLLMDARQNTEHNLPYQTRLVNESGLYKLIFSSKMEGAVKFTQWVTSEVLPSIRKTGKYEVPIAQPVELLNAEMTLKYVDKIEHLTTRFAQVQPRLAQVLSDHLLNRVIESNRLPSKKSQLRGVVEIAEDMGDKATDQGTRSQLGKFVKANSGIEAVQEKRLVNGTNRSVNCYPDTPEIRECIRKFFE